MPYVKQEIIMSLTMTFLTWATTLLFIGLVILMGRQYIRKSYPKRKNISDTTRLLLVLGILIMALGALLLIAMPFAS